MTKGIEQQRNVKKKPALSLKEKRKRKHDKKSAAQGFVSEQP